MADSGRIGASGSTANTLMLGAQAQLRPGEFTDPFDAAQTFQLYDDGSIQFWFKGKDYLVSNDGQAWVGQGDEFVDVEGDRSAVLERADALREYSGGTRAAAKSVIDMDTVDVAEAAPAPATSSLVAPAASSVRPSPPAPTAAVDRIETRPVGGAAPSSLEAKVAQLEKKLKAAEAKHVAELEIRAKAEAEAARLRLERDEKATFEAGKPGFWRGLLDLIQLIVYVVTPVMSMITLTVRTLRIGYELLAGHEINWKKEGMYALGELIGVSGVAVAMVWPPGVFLTGAASAAIHAMTDMTAGDSKGMRGGQLELVGGLNKLIDGGKTKRNPFRETFAQLFDGTPTPVEPRSAGAKTLDETTDADILPLEFESVEVVT